MLGARVTDPTPGVPGGTMTRFLDSAGEREPKPLIVTSARHRWIVLLAPGARAQRDEWLHEDALRDHRSRLEDLSALRSVITGLAKDIRSLKVMARRRPWEGGERPEVF